MRRVTFCFLGACAATIDESQLAGGEYVDGVFVAFCSAEVVTILYTKDRFPIIDDQACIPEPEVLGITISNSNSSSNNNSDNNNSNEGGSEDGETGTGDGDAGDGDTDPPAEKKKCNYGKGNGPEGDPDDCDPGNSGGKNQGGD